MHLVLSLRKIDNSFKKPHHIFADDEAINSGFPGFKGQKSEEGNLYIIYVVIVTKIYIYIYIYIYILTDTGYNCNC